MSVAVILLELTKEGHLVLVPHKQVLVSCLVEELSVRFDVADLLLVVALSHFVECIL